jgi:peptide/nickel transport system ATP-binding protein
LLVEGGGEEEPMSSPLIRISKLSVHFKSRPSEKLPGGVTRAVDDIDLEIEQGEVFSLVGESGSGKTTLGRTISGLLRPTRGVVEIAGEVIDYRKQSQLRRLWRKCQMVFQDPYSSFPPLSTIIESLEVPLNKYGIYEKQVEKQAAIETTLGEVGLSFQELAGKYPRELSGGQRQRASITRAMLVKPDILIADEPISMLDVSSRIGILKLLKDLNRKHGLTVVFITHDLGAAEYLGGRIGVMYRGQILEVAEPSELLQNPVNPYTEVLLKAAPRLANSAWLAEYDVEQRSREFIDASRGCSFYSRCPQSGSVCTKAKPPLENILTGKEHLVACYFPSPGRGSAPPSHDQ